MQLNRIKYFTRTFIFSLLFLPIADRVERDKNISENRKETPMDENKNNEQATVTLTLDDDTELECMVLTIFPAGGRDYIALLPMDDIEEEEGDVYLYRYEEDESGNPNLTNIEDDEEYEVAADAFDELLDAEEYDELVEEEDW
ncbi:MAG: DUF1292 domain-containing protein [Lachnospiraceae bacterium]|nr:DUF1292 domain-containing protein [Lachnospiraceae bacterium]